MILAIIIIIYVFVTVLEYIPLIKKKNKGEIILYTVLLVVGLILLSLIAINIKLPNPTHLIKYILGPIIKS